MAFERSSYQSGDSSVAGFITSWRSTASFDGSVHSASEESIRRVETSLKHIACPSVRQDL